MNIIVPLDGEVRFTQYVSNTPYDINSINFYLQKEPSKLELNYIDENEFSQKYEIALEKKIEQHNANYTVYMAKTDRVIPQRKYDCNLLFTDDSNVQFSLMTANEYYVDQHAPIYIQNKTLDVATSGITLVAEDSESECIIFRIEKTYDGISALDPSKTIYVDYIPANLNAETEKVSFYSDKILSRSEVEIDGKIYIDLKWIVPYNAVRAAGKLTIALAILGQSTSIDHDGNQIPYLWQTLPAVLTVRPNIALRHDIKITPEQTATLESVNAQVQHIQEFVDEIDNVSNINTETGEITYTTRENGASSTETISVADLMIRDFVDEEIILSGGDAPVEEEE